MLKNPFGNMFPSNNVLSVLTSPKGFSASKCDVENWIFSKYWNFLGILLEFFWNFFGIFWVFFWKFFGNFLGIFWEFFGNFLGIFWEFFVNSLGILWEFFGNSLWILWEFFENSLGMYCWGFWMCECWFWVIWLNQRLNDQQKNNL